MVLDHSIAVFFEHDSFWAVSGSVDVVVVATGVVAVVVVVADVVEAELEDVELVVADVVADAGVFTDDVWAKEVDSTDSARIKVVMAFRALMLLL